MRMSCGHRREVGFAQHRGAENLVAVRDAGAAQGHEVVLDHVEEAVQQLGRIHDRSGHSGAMIA
jgi:hypothetical protein